MKMIATLVWPSGETQVRTYDLSDPLDRNELMSHIISWVHDHVKAELRAA